MSSSGFIVKTESVEDWDKATFQYLTVTRSRGVRVYAILIVVAVCVCPVCFAALAKPLSLLDRDGHANVPYNLCNVGLLRQGYQERSTGVAGDEPVCVHAVALYDARCTARFR